MDFGSTRILFAELQQLICDKGFEPETAVAISHFGFATWFADVLPIAPCLLITGPALEAKFLLDLLDCVVRHPLQISEFAPRVLGSLPMELQPTLLINAEHNGGASLKLLRGSNRRGAFFPCNGNLVDAFAAKAVYCGSLVDARIISESALDVCLVPSGGKLPALSQKQSEEIAQNFQSKFLAYRSRHILDVRDSQYDIPEYASSTRMLARARRLRAACVRAVRI